MTDGKVLSDMPHYNSSARYSGALAEAPAFFILVAICFSLYFNETIPSAAALPVAILITFALVAFLSVKYTKGWIEIAVLVLVIGTTAAGYCLYGVNKKIELPNSIETSGRVTYTRSWGKGAAMIIDTPYGDFAAYVPVKDLPAEGSGVYVRGALFDFKSAEKPHGFDERYYWRAKGAIKRIALFETKVTSPPSGLSVLRAKFEHRIEKKLPPLTAAYISAFLVGAKQADLTELHKRAGTSHLLAVSGLHIWIIAGLFLLLMKSGAVRAVVVSLFIWGYLALLAFPVGGVRAALMVELLLIAAAVGKPSASFNNISIAAVLLLLYNPWYFFDIGWRLSVLSALFISAAVSVIGTGAWQTAAVSVLLCFVTAPVIALSFGEVPLAGLALNIAVIPIFGLIFPLVLVLSLPALIGLPLAGIAAQCAEVILTFFDKFILIGARILPGSLGWDTALYVLSLALFAAFAAARCCGGIKRSLTVAAFFVVFMLYSSAMM